MKHLMVATLAFLALSMSGMSGFGSTDANAEDFIRVDMSRGLVDVGFVGSACASIPTPFGRLIGGRDCMRVPTTAKGTQVTQEFVDGNLVKTIEGPALLIGTRDQAVTINEYDDSGVLRKSTVDNLQIADAYSTLNTFGSVQSLVGTLVELPLSDVKGSAEEVRLGSTGNAAAVLSDGLGASIGAGLSTAPGLTDTNRPNDNGG